LYCTSDDSSSFFELAAATIAKYEMTFFVFSVFPAPDSPLQKTRQVRQNKRIRSRQPAADPQRSPTGSRYDRLACRTPLGSRLFYQNGVDV